MPQEVQMELVRAEEEESEDDDEDEDEDGESELETSEYEVVLGGVTPRKRPSLVMLDGGGVEVDADADLTVDVGHRGPSPPKRARVDGTYSPSMMSMSPASGGLRKRSSEELDEGGEGEGTRGNAEHKRSRTESHPRSMSASAEVLA